MNSSRSNRKDNRWCCGRVEYLNSMWYSRPKFQVRDYLRIIRRNNYSTCLNNSGVETYYASTPPPTFPTRAFYSISWSYMPYVVLAQKYDCLCTVQRLDTSAKVTLSSNISDIPQWWVSQIWNFRIQWIWSRLKVSLV